MKLLLAVPFALLAAPFGAALAGLAVTSPRGLTNLLIRGLPRLLTKRQGMGGTDFLFVTPAPSFGGLLIRVLARAFGAFAAARLVLLAFGLGPVTVVAVIIGLALLAWDIFGLALIFRMSFPASAATIQLQRTKLIFGTVSSAVATFVFLRT